MSKTEKTIAKPVQHKMTKRQLSRWQRERKAQRWLYGLGGGVVLVIIALLGFASIQQYVMKPRAVAIKVDGQRIRANVVKKLVAFEQAQLEKQASFMLDEANKRRNSTSEQDKMFVQFLEQQGAQLQQQQSSVTYMLPEDIIDYLVMKRNASSQGVQIERADIDKQLAQMFPLEEPKTEPTPAASSSPAPAAASGTATATSGTPTPASTPTVGPTPTPPPPPRLDASAYEKTLKQFDLSRKDFEEYIVSPALLRNKLSTTLGSKVPTHGEQVRASIIMVETQDDANKAIDRIKKGEHFADVAKQVSKDMTTRDRGGMLDFTARGIRDATFDGIAFTLQPGQINQPVQVPSGFEIIKLEERAPDKPYSDSDLATLRNQAFEKWLSSVKQQAKIERNAEALYPTQ